MTQINTTSLCHCVCVCGCVCVGVWLHFLKVQCDTRTLVSVTPPKRRKAAVYEGEVTPISAMFSGPSHRLGENRVMEWHGENSPDCPCVCVCVCVRVWLPAREIMV